MAADKTKDAVQGVIKRIKEKKASVGIIGLGYVGLPLVMEFSMSGFPVTGFDIDPQKVNMLDAGKSYIKHIPSENIQKLKTDGRFNATSDFTLLRNCDCIVICVPTPLDEHREPDLSYVLDTTHIIAKYLRKGQLVVLESTTYPGTTDEDMKGILEKNGFRAGRDFFLAYSPEREDPANKDFRTSTIPKIVGGHTRNCLRVASALYDTIIIRTVPVSSTKAAEAAKLLENIYRAVNIALVNEMKMLFDKMGIDIWEVIEASKTKPFGFQAFYPGPGLGGHCIPIDPFYLTWKAREYGFSTRFIELAGQINTSMPLYVVSRIADALNEHGKSLKGSRILLLGLAYKKDVDDFRESPSFELIKLLAEKGARVDYNDPYVPRTIKTRKHDLKMTSVPLTENNLKRCDCVLIATDHSSYDYGYIARHSRLVVDTRNAMKGFHTLYRGKIVKA
jgi:UDP-N-acetyl-D-glucosamine dehydrogenase